jgi:hypothetical protein
VVDGSPINDPDSGCHAKTCADLGANCGAADDGCGGLLDCGKTCPDGQTCGAKKPNVCGGCAPRTCQDLAADCGKQGDGCGKIIDCGTCSGGQTCGGGGVPSQCGGLAGDGGVCTPKSCVDLGVNCGPIADGCGGIVDCGACSAPGDICGGGGTPNVCGGGLKCTPKTCADVGATCGVIDDTCGGVVGCGSCDNPGESCGGGGTPNVCGSSTSCKPKTCAELGATCGVVDDGCNGVLPSCGSCTAPQVCGGGGVPNVCGGGPPACTPKTCAELGATCGAADDGCGGVLPDCGSCGVGEVCGGGGPNVCSKVFSCKPKTCADLGATCGAVADGCGGVIPSCGTCAAPQTCSGDPAKLNQCGCTGVCAQVPTCAAGQTTTLTGKVKDPAGNTPLDHVLVYIPNNPADPALHSFPDQLTCDQCGASAAGSPLVTTYSGTDGSFTLSGVPVGKDITLVIQVGRWRRLFKVNIASSCQPNQVSGTGAGGTTISGGVLTMPRNKAQGDIPRMAVVTTLGDSLECTLYRMGIDLAEFTNPGGGGRIEMYTNPALGPGDVFIGGAYLNFSTPDSSQLVNKLPNYDMVVLGCPATPKLSGDPLLTNYDKLVSYANSGGRLFTTHYSYVYLQQGGAANPFSGTAKWSGVNAKYSSASVSVDTNPADNPKGAEFGDWLSKLVPLTGMNPPTFKLFEAHHDIQSVVAPSQQWLYFTPAGQNTPAPLHYTFNTPVSAPADSQCGRVVFSDFHVADNKVLSPYFPEECSVDGFSQKATPITPQEQILEYMLFDLGSCVQPYTPGCTPTSCTSQGVECGVATDGCGNALQCGSCPAGETCGGGGAIGKCGTMTCSPATCASKGIECGSTSDGCGNVLACGTCSGGQTCGGGGTPGKCGSATCTPSSCASKGLDCGATGDGCGKALFCGNCPAGQTCGGGGTIGKCGAAACTPATCAAKGAECGATSDGCGNALFCGNCPAGQTCGGGGKPGKCGAATCTPTTCAAKGVACGSIGDGCGAALDCGTCSGGQTCGGGGVVGQCGMPTCVPQDCGSRCGQQGDGCGKIIACPPCGGMTCTPTTCAAKGAECGPIGDGCGNVLDCGSCQGTDTCGGGGTPYKCGGGIK